MEVQLFIRLFILSYLFSFGPAFLMFLVFYISGFEKIEGKWKIYWNWRHISTIIIGSIPIILFGFFYPFCIANSIIVMILFFFCAGYATSMFVLEFKQDKNKREKEKKLED
jgi:hypothetical protein